MKTIKSVGENAQWSNELITDLKFIKKNLRYRFSKKILYGSAGLGFVLLIMVRLAYLLWVIEKTKVWSNPIMWGLLITLSFLILLPVFSYTQIIKFRVISTPFYVIENQNVIQQFLKSMHLMMYPLPDAPEVFQIMSKNLSVSNKKEQREIIVFIADDKRILVNSHYSIGGFNLQPPSRNYRLIRRQLEKFVRQCKVNTTSSDVRVNS
jgi:hypothetical protein